MSSSNRVSYAACLVGVSLIFSSPFAALTSENAPSDGRLESVHSVAVTPDAATTEDRSANTGGHVLTFNVTNTGTESDTYDLSCVAVAKAECGGISVTRLTLNSGQEASVDVNVSVSDTGAGLVSLVAYSPVTLSHDRGSFRLRVVR